MKNIASLFTKEMRYFMGGMILANLAGNMYRMYLPGYIVNELGASVTQVGLVFTIAAIFPLLTQFLGGWLSDSIGRLFAIFIGSIGGIVGYFMMVIAPSWPFMMAAIAIESFSQVMVAPSFGPFLADQSDDKRRGTVYGTATAIFTVISVIGPPLGGWIAEMQGTKTLLWIGMIPYTASFLVRAWMGVRELRRREETIKLDVESLKSSLKAVSSIFLAGGTIVWVILTGGVADILTKISREFLPLFLENVNMLTQSNVGIVIAFIGVAMMLVSIPAGYFSDKLGENRMIALGLFLGAVALIILVLTDVMLWLAVACFIFGMGAALLSAPFSSLVSKLVPKAHLGIAFGVFWTMRGLISFPTSFVSGVMWEKISPQTPFYLVIMVSLVFVGIAFKKLVMKNNVEDVQKG